MERLLQTLRVANRFAQRTGGLHSLRLAHAYAVASALIDAGLITAGAVRNSPLNDVSKLRFQAVFLMGAGGSGKGFVGETWMKYMPGAPPGGFPKEVLKDKFEEKLTEQERGLSNLNFERAVTELQRKGFTIEMVEGGGSAKIPFQLYSYDQKGREQLIPPDQWEQRLPKPILDKVRGLTNVIFKTPVHELPSYWRQVNPDIYKDELEGYMKDEPGYVHEMSSEMSKAYFEAAIESGDPVFVDGTGQNPEKMIKQITAAKAAKYRTSVVLVIVPLTVNQIRNATRSRNVDPNIITDQWYKIQDSYTKVKGVADKARIIINRNDPKDRKEFQDNAEKINKLISTKTAYDSLYDYIKAVAPNEIPEWGGLLKGED